MMQVPLTAHSRIYAYVDAEGLRHYTDMPDNSRYRLLGLSHDRTASGDRYDSRLLAKAGQYDSIIEGAAMSASVEPNLLRAVILVESGFNPRAVSKRGAVGLMQLMPATATRFGVSNPYDARDNVRAGARYLKFLLERAPSLAGGVDLRSESPHKPTSRPVGGACFDPAILRYRSTRSPDFCRGVSRVSVAVP